MRNIPLPILASALLLSWSGGVIASPLVYEGFNYSLSQDATINGATSTAPGLGAGSSVWSVTNTGGGSSLYQTTGLTFSSNFAPTTGGALKLSTSFTGSGSTTTGGLQLGTSATGTIWSSYLVQYSSIDPATGGSFGQGLAMGTPTGTTYLKANQTSNTTAATRSLLNGYDNSSSSVNFTFQINTTYLFISKFTNVGMSLSAGSPGVGRTWVMTQSQYDLWYAAGATEALLGTYANGTVSDTVTSGTFNFDSSASVYFRAAAPGFNSFKEVGVIDELRYATTLAEVTTVPEPSPLLACLAGFCGLFIVRRTPRRKL